MLFALICADKPGALEIRKATRPAHLDWLKSLGPALKFAGPFLTSDGAGPCGSLIVFEAASLDQARMTAAGDPYARAGLFATADIKPWVWAVNAPSGAS